MRILALLGLLLAVAGGAAAQSQVRGALAGGGHVLPPYPPWYLPAQYSGYTLGSNVFPTATWWVIPNSPDQITAICGLPSTPGGACNGTLTAYPSQSVTYPSCPSGAVTTGTVGGSAGSEIGGVYNAGIKIIESMQGTSGVGVNPYPECQGYDNGEWATTTAFGLHQLGAGPSTETRGPPYVDPTTRDSAPNTAGGFIDLATHNNALATLIGYFAEDEPQCPGSGTQYTSDSPAQFSNLQFFDPTRPVWINQAIAVWLNPASNHNQVSVKGTYMGNINPLANGQPWSGAAGINCFTTGVNPSTAQLPASYVTSLQSSSIAGFDGYTLITESASQSQGYQYQANSDFVQYPHDRMFLQGLAADIVNYYKLASQPFWPVVEGANGGKASGSSTLVNPTSGVDVVNGSTTITIHHTTGSSNASNNCATVLCVSFGPVSSVGCTLGTTGCSMWLGMTVDDSTANGGSGCITSGQTITAVTADGLGFANNYTATISAPASCPGGVNVTSDKLRIANNTQNIGNGALTIGRACIYSTSPFVSLCGSGGGSRFRTSGAEVNSEVWQYIIHGATGIGWFPQDSYGPSGWSYGANSAAGNPGNPAATQAAANRSLMAVQYVNLLLQQNALWLNTVSLGQCATDYVDPAHGGTDIILPSCQSVGGFLTVTPTDQTYPGQAIVKQGVGGPIYLIAMPQRCSEPNCFDPNGTWDHRSGGSFKFSLAGYAGHTGAVYYDSDSQFDPANDSTGTPITLDGTGSFTDTLGAHSDKYQVKIYRFQ